MQQTAADTLEVLFFDVGQGDALLLHQPGTCAILIDAGSLIHGHHLTSTLQNRGIDQLDMVIITHPHLDHFGGLFDLAPRLPILEFFDNGAENPNWEYFDEYKTIRARQPNRTLTRNDTLSCGGLKLEVVHPQNSAAYPEDLNGGSLAIRISFQNFRLLHMGDVAGAAEHHLLEQADDLTADIIKLAHHGAADATSPALLERVRPAQAIISVARDNRFDSPDPQTLSRLADYQVEILRTDELGTISFSVTPQGYTRKEP